MFPKLTGKWNNNVEHGTFVKCRHILEAFGEFSKIIAMSEASSCS